MPLYAFISIICGTLSFSLIAGSQATLLLQTVHSSIENPHVFSIAAPLKLICTLLGIIGLFMGIRYLRSGEKTLIILNKLGMILSIAGILMSLIPFYLLLLMTL